MRIGSGGCHASCNAWPRVRHALSYQGPRSYLKEIDYEPSVIGWIWTFAILEVHLTELVPNEAVDGIGNVVEAVFGESLGHDGLGAPQQRDDLLVRLRDDGARFREIRPSQFICTKREVFQSLLQKLR